MGALDTPFQPGIDTLGKSLRTVPTMAKMLAGARGENGIRVRLENGKMVIGNMAAAQQWGLIVSTTGGRVKVGAGFTQIAGHPRVAVDAADLGAVIVDTAQVVAYTYAYTGSITGPTLYALADVPAETSSLAVRVIATKPENSIAWAQHRTTVLIGPQGSESAFPFVGATIDFHGAVEDIPAGWYLCDGTHGTANLAGRFVVGVGTYGGETYAMNDSGGFTWSGITENNHLNVMLAHYHKVTPAPANCVQFEETVHADDAAGTYEVDTTDVYEWTGTITSTQTKPDGTSLLTMRGHYNPDGDGIPQDVDNRPPWYALAKIEYRGT